MAAARGLTLAEIDPELAPTKLSGIPPGGEVPGEARAGFQVEPPAVVDAGEHRADHLAVYERIPLVRARVVERVHLSLRKEDGELAAIDLDERSITLECVRWNPMPALHAT